MKEINKTEMNELYDYKERKGSDANVIDFLVNNYGIAEKFIKAKKFHIAASVIREEHLLKNSINASVKSIIRNMDNQRLLEFVKKDLQCNHINEVSKRFPVIRNSYYLVKREMSKDWGLPKEMVANDTAVLTSWGNSYRSIAAKSDKEILDYVASNPYRVKDFSDWDKMSSILKHTKKEHLLKKCEALIKKSQPKGQPIYTAVELANYLKSKKIKDLDDFQSKERDVFMLHNSSTKKEGGEAFFKSLLKEMGWRSKYKRLRDMPDTLDPLYEMNNLSGMSLVNFLIDNVRVVKRDDHKGVGLSWDSSSELDHVLKSKFLAKDSKIRNVSTHLKFYVALKQELFIKRKEIPFYYKWNKENLLDFIKFLKESIGISNKKIEGLYPLSGFIWSKSIDLSRL